MSSAWLIVVFILGWFTGYRWDLVFPFLKKTFKDTTRFIKKTIRKKREC